MERISLLSIFLILFSFSVSSQEMTISEFKEFPMDMDAKLNYPKKNINDGELFAIIKVETSLKCEDFQLFDFGSVGNGDIDCSNGNRWVYAPATATKLSINHRLAGSIVNFPLPMQLKAATVYKMKIESGRQISRIEETLTYGYLVVESNVDGALLKIFKDGSEIKSDYISDKDKTITLAPGQYTYTVEAVDYETERGVFIIKNEESSSLVAKLRSSMGSLSVNSSPEQGAYVNINGKKQERTTPATFPLRKGNYQITVYKDLYKQAEATVTVSAGEQSVYNAVLSANFAEVAVDAPAGAYVYIDGNQSGEGKWAGRLEVGLHNIEVRKASHSSFKTSVTLANGEKKSIAVPSLAPIYGKLNVITDPAYAQVFIDGVEYGSKTPCVVKDVLVGDRKVRLIPASSEYETLETTVNVSEGKITDLNKTFTEKPKAVVATATVNKTSATCGADFTDSRDNQVYSTVKIGSQCWMSKNLNYGSRVSGDDYDTHKRTGVQKICYENSESNCSKYGGLYNWNEAVNGENSGSIKYVSGSSTMIQGICPDGWHVPSDEEFKTLEKYLGMSSSEADKEWAWRGTDEGRKLKSRDYWDVSSSTSGTNSSGWDGRPGGGRNNSGGTFDYVGAYGYWWSSSENSSSDAWTRHLNYPEARVYRSNFNKSYGFSVRCLLNDVILGEVPKKTDTLETTVNVSEGKITDLNKTSTSSDEDGYFIDGNLMIMKQDLGGLVKYKTAKGMCEESRLGGFSDWRLPSDSELGDIYRNKNHIDVKAIFDSFQSDWYWSSTPYSGNNHGGLDFSVGLQNIHYSDLEKVPYRRCRCVRDVR
ncbi:MAG: PEGA domain-containing protein [Culturomica sp.]|jgi:uncharacterized protein (TIGR02145 family)|nr:PEGA domain-containing protein [Culturomica sp.]